MIMLSVFSLATTRKISHNIQKYLLAHAEMSDKTLDFSSKRLNCNVLYISVSSTLEMSGVTGTGHHEFISLCSD